MLSLLTWPQRITWLGSVVALWGGVSCTVWAENYQSVNAGSVIQVRLSELLPTQKVVGFDQIYYKLGRFQREPSKLFDEYCETNGQGGLASKSAQSTLSNPDSFGCKADVGTYPNDMKTVVIGPQGKLYLTDGHHTFTVLSVAAEQGLNLPMWVRVADNHSGITDEQAFWQRMQAEGKVWLKNSQGQAISAQQLPQQLGMAHFEDDPYRSLVYFTRKVAYDKPRSGDVAPEYLEFYWGQWLRDRMDLAGYDLNRQRSYRKAVLDASEWMVSQAPEQKISEQYTARQLGGFTRVDHKALGKTSKEKLSDVLRYRNLSDIDSKM